mgnify:CR=1 FL=1
MKRGKYFRIVADVDIDGQDLGRLLIHEGYAQPYDGSGKKPKWGKSGNGSRQEDNQIDEWFCQRPDPFFCRSKRSINKSFAQVDAASVTQVFGQRNEHLLENVFTRPVLEAAMAGTSRWIPLRQVFPWRAGTENPEDAVEDIARSNRRSPLSSRPTAR